MRHRDVEIFVLNGDPTAVLNGVRQTVGEPDGPHPLGDGRANRYDTPNGERVILRPGCGSPPRLLGIHFTTGARPWDTDIDCGRAAARALGCVVRCDPGAAYPDVHPLSDTFVDIAPDGTETRVECDD